MNLIPINQSQHYPDQYLFSLGTCNSAQYVYMYLIKVRYLIICQWEGAYCVWYLVFDAFQWGYQISMQQKSLQDTHSDLFIKFCIKMNSLINVYYFCIFKNTVLWHLVMIQGWSITIIKKNVLLTCMVRTYNTVFKCRKHTPPWVEARLQGCR